MAKDNSIMVIGNLTRDPELRYTTAGRAVCDFSVAQTPRFMKDGEWTDGETSFFNCSAWAELGENIAASIQKGHRVIVLGRMEQRRWETEDGDKRTAYDIVCDEVAPSLRWGTTTYEKTARSGGSSDRSPRQQQRSEPVYGDEEPF